MYGAIIGDIVGSRFEFDRGDKKKTFEMFTKDNNFTDDTVMTVAVAEALISVGKEASEQETKNALINSIKTWGRAYPYAGYGGRFKVWLFSDDTKPYGSYGNGSAMRVSAAGWLYDTIEKTREVARLTAEVTHNHPEGIKGAESTAAIIFLARNGFDKPYIKQYILDNFGYDLSRSCDDIRPSYRHVESCQETVPEAITAFLEGEDFEDVVRTAVSLGGDCDTLTDIAAAMGEAYYKVPEEFKRKCDKYLDDKLKNVLDRFYDFIDIK